MKLEYELVRAINRRYFFGQCGAGLGLGAIALASLLGDEARGRTAESPVQADPKGDAAPGSPKTIASRPGQARHLPAHGRLPQPARPVRRQAGIAKI